MKECANKKMLDSVGGELIQTGMNLIRKGQEMLAKSKYNTITVVSRWYNEEILAPFFLEHYSYADEIIILLDEKTTDGSRKIIERYPNTRIIDFACTGEYNVQEASNAIMKVVYELSTDWIICADPDEFVFPKGFVDVREVLAEVDGNVVYADMWQVYRNKIEADLDPTVKAIHMRRFGEPSREPSVVKRMDKKPIIVRSGLNLKWCVGLHAFEPDEKLKVSSTVFDGAHWKMADVELAIARRLRGRREHVSETNVQAGWACDDFDITERDIRKECEKHLDDPQLF